MSRPLFVTFEGPEGGGKSTQIRLLAQYLISHGHSVHTTRQPGGEPVGIELRRIMLDIGRDNVHPRAELLMMMADRSQSVESVIRPHLDSGGIVLCDRYIDSSVAYQGAGRGIDRSWIGALNNYATAGLTPDLTILLDIDPEIGLGRQLELTKMELMDLNFHHRVRDAFLSLAVQYPKRIKTVDGSLPIATVQGRIQAIVEQELTSC